MSRSEFDANRDLLAIEPDPLEQTQRMPVADRRYRQREAAGQWLCSRVADQVQRQIDNHVDELVRVRFGDFRDHGRLNLTSHERAQQDGFSDGE